MFRRHLNPKTCTAFGDHRKAKSNHEDPRFQQAIRHPDRLGRIADHDGNDAAWRIHDIVAERSKSLAHGSNIRVQASDALGFRLQDLERFPENGWALFGLTQALRAQGKTAAADEAESRFREAWSGADVELTASRF